MKISSCGRGLHIGFFIGKISFQLGMVNRGTSRLLVSENA